MLPAVNPDNLGNHFFLGHRQPAGDLKKIPAQPYPNLLRQLFRLNPVQGLRIGDPDITGSFVSFLSGQLEHQPAKTAPQKLHPGKRQETQKSDQDIGGVINQMMF